MRAYVRVDLDGDGRLYPGVVLMQAHAGRKVRALRGADLRTFPLAAVEAQANGELRDQILAGLATKVDVRFAAADGGLSAAPPGTRGTIKGDARSLRQMLRPKVPDTRPYPDEFYAEIANAYTYLASSSRRPAAQIAEVFGVPTKTVHRWVTEARKRGHLAPGRKGKAG